MTDVPPNPPPLSSNLYVQDPKGPWVIDPKPPTWLVTVLSNPGIPPTFQGDLYSPDPLTNDLLPSEAISAIKLIFEGASPLYLGMLRDKSLTIATTASHEAVDVTLCFPHNPTIPTACH
ncbi:hypothetical protein EDC04DRAFT_2906683 [Pisolithus marmoratus]|nr:hypothetical protein EDC04DRAFT_2906683 [Pisolithus marmoratus]